MILVVFMSVFMAGCGGDEKKKSEEKPDYKYSTIEIDDISFAGCKRVSLKIALDQEYTQEEIKEIVKEVVKKQKDRDRWNFIGVFVYNEGDEYNWGYTVAKCDYAPYGDIKKAMEVYTGDYSKHEYNFTFK